MSKTRRVAIILIPIIALGVFGISISAGLAQTQGDLHDGSTLNDAGIIIYLTAEANHSMDPTLRANTMKRFYGNIVQATRDAVFEATDDQIHRQSQKLSNPAIVFPQHTAEVPPDGINDHPDKPIQLSHPKYKLTNSWRKTTEDHHVYTVFGGAAVDDPTQGVAYVYVPGMSDFSVFPCPIKDGSSMITAENNMVLTMKSENGNEYYFDVNQLKFVDNNGDAVTNQRQSIDQTSTSEPAYP